MGIQRAKMSNDLEKWVMVGMSADEIINRYMQILSE